MNILVTGGFGNVGRSAVLACLAAGHSIAIFESPSALKKAGAGLRRLLNTKWASCTFVFGDIRSQADIGRAFSTFPDGPDAVIHLAALIPPAAEKDPEKTKSVNIGGTTNIIEACRSARNHPRLVFASSIAIYGDRLKNFWIKTSDEIHPTEIYSETKAECETLLRASGLDFTVLRLSYVVWAKWLPFDPLLFSMPPETRLEIIHTEDAGRAFAAAASHPSIGGQTLDIGGGSLCRTFFRAFLDRVFRYFGLGDSTFLPESAFAAANFHCGWYEDSDYADSLLHFRRKTLEDYYEEVRWETRFLSRLVFIVGPIVKLWLARKSPFSPPPRQQRQTNRSGRQLWKKSLQTRKQRAASSPKRLRSSGQERL